MNFSDDHLNTIQLHFKYGIIRGADYGELILASGETQLDGCVIEYVAILEHEVQVQFSHHIYQVTFTGKLLSFDISLIVLVKRKVICVFVSHRCHELTLTPKTEVCFYVRFVRIGVIGGGD